MAASLPNLRLLDHSPAAKELDLASELFHRINRILPQDQSLLVIPPDCLVRDAVALMRKHSYSQMPVVDNGEVLGVISFRSLAQETAGATLDEWTKQKRAPGDLRVDEFLEQIEFARATEEMSHVFDAMDWDNGVLIGTPERLVGILTPMVTVHGLKMGSKADIVQVVGQRRDFAGTDDRADVGVGRISTQSPSETP